MIIVPLTFMIGLICGAAAILDMMMNGSRNADWAPWGLSIAGVCMIIVWSLTK